jgi:hypothetical protein
LPDLVDEVDEELRAERAKRLAQRYGGIVTGIALLAVAGVAGWEGWRWYEGRQAGQAAQSFLTAARLASAEGADMREAATRFAAVANDAPAGYRTLARLREAALLAEAGDVPAALAAWDRVARDDGVDRLYRDLATVMWGLHAVDTTEPGQVEARVTPLAADNAPWRATAREVLALAQLRRGANAEARRSLERLVADAATPQGVRDRATRLLSGIGG